jgi:hypothetical protein
MKNDNPIDHAHVVLENAPITTEQKADIWDEGYRAPNADSLVRSLEGFDIPPHLVAALLTAKRLIGTEQPAPSHADKVKAAMQQMANLDETTLGLAEKYPHVLQHLLNEPSKKD